MKSIPFKLLPVAAAVGAVASAAIAAPPAPQALQGTASVSTSGSVHTVNSSANAVLNFPSFNVLPGETVRFVQPNAASTVLNRVLGGGVNIGGTVDSNGRVLFQMNGFVTGSGFSLDLGATALSSLKLGAPLVPQTALMPVVPAGEEVLASLAQGRVLVFAGEGTNSRVAASPTGEVMVPPGGTVELADIAWPNIRVEVTAPSDRPLNVSRLLAQNSVTGVFSGLFAGPKLRVRTGSDAPVMVASEAFPSLTGGRYASPSLDTMRFIESALLEIARGRTVDPSAMSPEQTMSAVAGISLPVAGDGKQDKDAVAVAAQAVARGEIVVASIRPAQVAIGFDSSAGPVFPTAAGKSETKTVPAAPAKQFAAAQISEATVAGAKPVVSVAGEIGESRVAAEKPALPAGVQVGELNVPAAVSAAPQSARIGEMTIAAEISEWSIAAADPAVPADVQVGELNVSAVVPAAPQSAQISEITVAAAKPPASVAAEISEVSIAAAESELPADVQVGELNVSAVVPAAPQVARISEMTVAAVEPAASVAAEISEASISAVEPAAPVAPELGESSIAAAKPALPADVQVGELNVSAAVPAAPRAARISGMTIAAMLPAASAAVQAAPVIILAPRVSSMPAPKLVKVATAEPVRTPPPQRSALVAPTLSSEPVSAVAEMVADLPLTKRDIRGDSDSTKVAQAAQPRLPAFVMDHKGGIFYL